MSEWKLKDCCLSISDGDHLPPPKADSGIPFITISNIDSTNHIDFDNTLFVPYDYYEKLDIIRKAQPNDILYSVVGSFGKPIYIKSHKRFVFQRHIAILKPNNSIVDSRYLYYKMLSRDFYMQADAVAIGAAQRTISLTALRNMTVNLPELAIQHRIATILSSYDSLIENYQKQIKLLEEAAQRLYKEWFIDLRFPGHENTKIVDGVPEGWEKKKVGKVCDINKTNISKEYKYDYIRYTDLGNVREGTIQESVRYYYGQEPGRAKRIAKDGDTIWGMVRPNLKSFALVQNPQPYDVYSTGFAVLSPVAVPFTFLYCALTTVAFVGYLVNCTNGAAYPAVKAEHFENAEIMIPYEKLLESFHHISKPIFRKIKSLSAQIRLLTEARDRLLPKLMNGEIDY